MVWQWVVSDPFSEVSNGDIWFGHLNGGISRYNGYIFEQAAFDSITITGDVTSIVAMNDTSIWFTSINDGAILAEFPVKDIKHIKARQFGGKDGSSIQSLRISTDKSR